MKLRSISVGIVTFALLALGCSSDDDSSAAPCTPGDRQSCACTTGNMSEQVCNASGTFDSCMCGVSVGTGGTVGTGGDVGAGGSAGAGAMVGTGGVPMTSGPAPQIPPVNGDCPTFTTQTLDFMSLRGINMQAGPPSNGTGVLLFYWHGTGSAAGEVAIIGAGQQRILETGGVIISPQSSTGSTMGLQASGTSVWFAEDLTTADQIAACAVRDHGIDPRRIYATGCSAGGLMTGYMATNRSQYIAAAAPNSGGALGQSFTGPYVPPIMTMHGAAGRDVVVLDFAMQSLQFTALAVSSGGFAIDCDHMGGHCGVPPDLYAAAITFLLDHPYGVTPEPYAAGLPGGFPAYCAIQ